MTDREPMAELDARFSSEDATAREWSEGRQHLERAEVYWISTVRPGGRPHVNFEGPFIERRPFNLCLMPSFSLVYTTAVRGATLPRCSDHDQGRGSLLQGVFDPRRHRRLAIAGRRTVLAALLATILGSAVLTERGDAQTRSGGAKNVIFVMATA